MERLFNAVLSLKERGVLPDAVLDGRPLDLWDSFGRLSGYTAGLATGLLGFAQVFWDPNRQAIQDKIAGTVVIRTNLPKHPVPHEPEPASGPQPPQA